MRGRGKTRVGSFLIIFKSFPVAPLLLQMTPVVVQRIHITGCRCEAVEFGRLVVVSVLPYSNITRQAAAELAARRGVAGIRQLLEEVLGDGLRGGHLGLPQLLSLGVGVPSGGGFRGAFEVPSCAGAVRTMHKCPKEAASRATETTAGQLEALQLDTPYDRATRRLWGG